MHVCGLLYLLPVSVSVFANDHDHHTVTHWQLCCVLLVGCEVDLNVPLLGLMCLRNCHATCPASSNVPWQLLERFHHLTVHHPA